MKPADLVVDLDSVHAGMVGLPPRLPAGVRSPQLLGIVLGTARPEQPTE
jgi:hypothetical protein